MFQVIATPPLSKDTTVIAKDVSYQVAIALRNMAIKNNFRNIEIVENFYGSLKNYLREIQVK